MNMCVCKYVCEFMDKGCVYKCVCVCECVDKGVCMYA